MKQLTSKILLAVCFSIPILFSSYVVKASDVIAPINKVTETFSSRPAPDNTVRYLTHEESQSVMQKWIVAPGKPEVGTITVGGHWTCHTENTFEICRFKLVACDDDGFCVEP